MLGILLDQLVSSGKFKAMVVRYSFYTFNGILGGIFMNDIIRILFGDVDLKHQYQCMIAAAVGGSGYLWDRLALFGDKENNVFLGLGLGIGHYWSELSEQGKRII